MDVCLTYKGFRAIKFISRVAWNQDKVTNASLLLVICADLNAWAKEPTRYWAGAPQMYQDILIPAIDAYYRDKPQVHARSSK
ncbi:MAG: hypothetical protein Q7W05_03085 [Deltaproteobacteria bacterium]|nr:hypothetical protein [Deltaproteobacteria bacterium]